MNRRLLAAAIILAPFSTAANSAMECKAELPAARAEHWSWRNIDGKRCWYPGQPGMDKANLYWVRLAPARSPEDAITRSAIAAPTRKSVGEATDAGAGTNTKSRLRTTISLPDQEQLIPQPEPDCEFKSSQPDQPDPNTERMKLDYERQCYRHAEMNARRRLERLQAAVASTVKAIKQQNSR
jgi:hypothetical protein